MKRKDEKLIKETRRDFLAETEEKLGKRHEDFTEAEQAFSLFNFMMENERKNNILDNAGDTSFRTPWNKFIAMLINNGFEFQNAWSYDKDGLNPKLQVFTKPEELMKDGSEPYDVLIMFARDGMLLVATSYGDHINGGHLYYERELKEGVGLYDIKSLSSFGMFADRKFHGYYDIREALMVHVRELEEKSTAMPIWEDKDPRPWILSYVDEKIISNGPDSHNTYNKTINDRIKEASPAIRTMCAAFIDEPITLEAGTYKNSDITKVDLSKVNIAKIEEGAFEKCPNLKQIVIDSDVKVPTQMIKNCPSLESLIVHGVEIPLQNGQVLDNSLTGIIAKLSQDDSYKDSEYLKDITLIQSRLQTLYTQEMKEHKLDILEMLVNVRDNAETEKYLRVNVPNLVELSKYYGSDEFRQYNRDEYSGTTITAKEFKTKVNEIIAGVISGQIKELSLGTDSMQKYEWTVESKQAKLIREDVEKIAQEIGSLTMMKDGVFEEKQPRNDEAR